MLSKLKTPPMLLRQLMIIMLVVALFGLIAIPAADASTDYPVGGSCLPLSSSNDQLCDPVSTVNISVAAASTLEISYTAPGFCSLVSVILSVDGGPTQESAALAVGSTDSFFFPVAAGPHVITVQGRGHTGGCNGGSLGNWGGGYITVTVPPPPIPATKDDCKNGGWESLTDDEGTPFTNQGDCVSFVATGGSNKAKDDASTDQILLEAGAFD